jgi:hypothetical protein
MLSEAANQTESTMPGDYAQLPGSATRARPFLEGSRSTVPRILPTSQPQPTMHNRPSAPNVNVRTVQSRRYRRRSLTPEIVIERRCRSHHRSGRHRIITIPLDHRPTLGLRGPPKRVIEIERVRCHRRRRSRSSCYDDETYSSTVPQQPNVFITNPMCNPCLSLAPQVPLNVSSTALFANLTQEAIDNLPRNTVHLPPIHLPGSQADANTELHTVTFPAEIINPVDGTLSIIQANPSANMNPPSIIQPVVQVALPSQMNSVPIPVGVTSIPGGSSVSPAIAPDQLMQRFRQLFQRLTIPQTQPSSSSAPNSSSSHNAAPIAPSLNSGNKILNVGPYPPANIQPSNSLNIPTNTTENIPTYNSPSLASSDSAYLAPYRASNFTPNSLTGSSVYRPSRVEPSVVPSARQYTIPSVRPTNPMNNNQYRPSNVAPSNASDVGPYHRANITPYSNTGNHSGEKLLIKLLRLIS